MPEVNQLSCVENNGTSDAPTQVQGIMPDLSTFVLSSETIFVRGIECNLWVNTFSVGSKVNTYQFMVSLATGAPVSFAFFGYDVLFGSHYDQYKIDFMSWRPNVAIDASKFNKPNMTCGSFPGPGMYGSAHERSVLAELTDIPAYHQAADSHFSRFKSKHSKKYATVQEHHFRKSIFQNHMRFIDSINRRHLSYKLDMNHMGDWKTEQFQRLRGVRSSRPATETRFVAAAMDKFPPSLDWRTVGAVSPVKDQVGT